MKIHFGLEIIQYHFKQVYHGVVYFYGSLYSKCVLQVALMISG